MNITNPFDEFYRNRHLAYVSSCRTTLGFNRSDGTHVNEFSPFAPLKPRESLVEAWGNARAIKNPEPRELCTLLTAHPGTFDMWTISAQIVATHCANGSSLLHDIIPHAQGTVWIKFGGKARALESATKRPVVKFPGWAFLAIFHKCQQSADEQGAQWTGKKALQVELWSNVKLDQTVDGIDVAASLAVEEVQLLIEHSDERTRDVIALRLEGLTQQQIAEVLGLSRDQVARVFAKLKQRPNGFNQFG
jgi:hypothetical protein